MHIVIAGGRGKIALLLAEAAARRGDTVDGLIRDPRHADEVLATGARPVVVDLESTTPAELAALVKGSDAVVFAAEPVRAAAWRASTASTATVRYCSPTPPRRQVSAGSCRSRPWGRASRPPRAPTRCGPPISTRKRRPRTISGAAISTGRSCGRAAWSIPSGPDWSGSVRRRSAVAIYRAPMSPPPSPNCCTPRDRRRHARTRRRRHPLRRCDRRSH